MDWDGVAWVRGLLCPHGEPESAFVSRGLFKGPIPRPDEIRENRPPTKKNLSLALMNEHRCRSGGRYVL